MELFCTNLASCQFHEVQDLSIYDGTIDRSLGTIDPSMIIFLQGWREIFELRGRSQEKKKKKKLESVSVFCSPWSMMNSAGSFPRSVKQKKGRFWQVWSPRESAKYLFKCKKLDFLTCSFTNECILLVAISAFKMQGIVHLECKELHLGTVKL